MIFNGIRNTALYKYDKNGNVIEEKETNDKNSSTTTHTYKYDDDGHMIEDIRKSEGINGVSFGITNILPFFTTPGIMPAFIRL